MEEVEHVAAAPVWLISTRFEIRSIIDRRSWWSPMAGQHLDGTLTPAQFSTYCPRLYHKAEFGTWDGI